MNGWTRRERLFALTLLCLCAALLMGASVQEAFTFNDLTVNGTFRSKGSTARVDGHLLAYGDGTFGTNSTNDATFESNVVINGDSLSADILYSAALRCTTMRMYEWPDGEAFPTTAFKAQILVTRNDSLFYVNGGKGVNCISD